MKYPKRLIEVDLPIKRISAHARREKSIRHGHISTLHIWWARRPLAACRAVILASLWPDPVDVTEVDVNEARKEGKSLALNTCPPSFIDAAKREMTAWALKNQKLCSPESFPRFLEIARNPSLLHDAVFLRGTLLDFIADFANWDNSSNHEYLATSRALTQAAHEAVGGSPGTRPLVVDPFAGGGSIPLEALRVGADAFASDLNPVPVLLNKVVLEYIPKYGQRLADGLKEWGKWIKRAAEEELATLYPKDDDGATPIAYLWARTIRCEGPGCGAEIPLLRSPCLAQRGNDSVYLVLKCDTKKKLINFELERGNISPDRLHRVLRRSSATCPLCGYTTPAANVRGQFKGRKGGAADARLLAVVTTKPGDSGRRYRLAVPQDEQATTDALEELRQIRESAPADVPDEPLPYLRSIFNIHLLDATKWSYLFTPRQMVSLVKLTRLIRTLVNEVQKTNIEGKLQEAIVTCLALAVDRVAAQFSSLSWWQPKGEFVAGTFGRQALGIVWDFAEIRPVGGASGDLDGAIDWVVRVVESNCGLSGEATVEKASATQHPLPNDSAAAVVTDPPYYDAVPYADLSDFFYVFLKRMLRQTQPTLFSDELAPKNGEVVQLAERNPIYAFKTKEYFERGMSDALSEARRITTPEGVSVIVFAHKTTQGWEVMLSSIINAGWVVTASWPIDTERAVRMRATGSAALASSVHLVCRPRENADGSVRTNDVGDWRDVLQELPRRIHEWMPRLADEGVVGADAIFACLGPALEIFSRYSRVEKASGEVVSLKDYLEHVWAAVSQEALSAIFHGASTEGFEPDARLTAMWLWTLSAPDAQAGDELNDEEEDSDDEEDARATKGKKSGYSLEFDAARKIAQGLGAHLEDLGSLIEISGETARLLPVAERTQDLFGKEQAQAPTSGRKAKKKSQMDLFSELTKSEDLETTWGEKAVTRAGETTLDRIHQSMILFAAGRGEAMRRFLVDDGVGKDQRFWRLANALAALYPRGTDERRWVEGVLARKKGLGL